MWGVERVARTGQGREGRSSAATTAVDCTREGGLGATSPDEAVEFHPGTNMAFVEGGGGGLLGGEMISWTKHGILFSHLGKVHSVPPCLLLRKSSRKKEALFNFHFLKHGESQSSP